MPPGDIFRFGGLELAFMNVNLQSRLNQALNYLSDVLSMVFSVGGVN
jgi:hypothetical protein